MLRLYLKRFRNVNIGFAVTVALVIVGLLIVGLDPTETEKQIVFWVSAVVGFAVLIWLNLRDYKRDIWR